MRTILTFGVVVIFLLFGYILLGIFWIYGKFNKEKADLIQLRIIQSVFRLMQKTAGIHVTVIGEENLPNKDEAVLYVANHRSMTDVVITYARCSGLTGFVSKDVIEKVPALRAWMKRLHCEFLVRDDMKQGLKVILSCIDKVKNGISIFIFPEGTRNKNSEDPTDIGTFKDGSFKIASKTGCKIIPIAITGTNKVFEDHLPWIKSANVILEYGEPVYFKDLDKEDQKHVGEYFQKKIQGMLIEHQKLN